MAKKGSGSDLCILKIYCILSSNGFILSHILSQKNIVSNMGHDMLLTLAFCAGICRVQDMLQPLLTLQWQRQWQQSHTPDHGKGHNTSHPAEVGGTRSCPMLRSILIFRATKSDLLCIFLWEVYAMTLQTKSNASHLRHRLHFGTLILLRPYFYGYTKLFQVLSK